MPDEKLFDALKDQIASNATEIKEMFTEQKTKIDETGATTQKLLDDLNGMNTKQNEIEKKQAEIEQKFVEMGRMPNGMGKNEFKQELCERYELEDPSFGFKNLGEFLVATRKANQGSEDDRLKAVTAHMEQKELSAGTGSEGGYWIPPQFGEPIKAFQPQAGIFRPRSTVIPAGSPPDAEIQLPALDQSGANGVYAGVEVVWLKEGGTKSETDFGSRQITLKPHEAAGFITITNKLLVNAPALGVVAENLLRKAIMAFEDQAFYNGDGAGKPLGVLGHASAIVQTRAVANQISYLDIVNMYSQIVFGGSYIWAASQTTLPQLMTMEDSAGHLIWMPNKDAIGGQPGTLLGMPLTMNNRSATLGNEGDIGLLDLSYYYIKDGSGIIVESSPHVEFKKNKTLIKATFNVDGQPAITSPLTDENGEEISPFVFLDNAVTPS